MFSKNAWITILLGWMAVWVNLANAPVLQSTDSMWAIPTALSLITEGNPNLDEYKDQVAAIGGYATETRQGHIYNIYPPGVAYLSVPPLLVVAPIRYAAAKISASLQSIPFNQDFWQYSVGHLHHLERWVAGFWVSLYGLFLFLLGRAFLSWQGSLACALVGIYATSAWSTASRGLWQHGPTIALVAAMLWIGFALRPRLGMGLITGVLAGLSVTVRPTNIVIVPLFALYLGFWQAKPRRDRWRDVLAFGGGGGVVLVLFVTYSWSIYQQWFPPYYSANNMLSLSTFGEALLGNLLSPSRGILVYSPFLVFGVFAFFGKSAIPKPLIWISGLAILGHWGLISAAGMWYGGVSYGPRFFCDALPYFMVLLIPFLAQWDQHSRAGKAGFAILVLCGFFIHYRGANDQVVLDWNDHNTQAKLWDYASPQFLWGLMPPGRDQLFYQTDEPETANCAQLIEPLDPAWQGGIFLCSNEEVRLSWSYEGKPDQGFCVQWSEPGEPMATGWSDNYLCADRDLGFSFSEFGPRKEAYCTPVGTKQDPHGWHDNFLCWRKGHQFELAWNQIKRITQ